jgi:hypothetical protein
VRVSTSADGSQRISPRIDVLLSRVDGHCSAATSGAYEGRSARRDRRIEFTRQQRIHTWWTAQRDAAHAP